MRSIPSAFSSLFSRPAVYLLRLRVLDEGSPAYLWCSSLDLSAFSILYDGDLITPSADYIAAAIRGPSGNTEKLSGIGEVDFSLDLQSGGNVGAVGETQIILLNQGSLVSSHEYDIENQPLEIWEMRLPTDTGVDHDITVEGILRFKGVVRDAAVYDPTRWTLRATDRRLIESRLIPAARLNRDTFSFLPAEQIGKVGQIVLGDHYSGSFDQAYGAPIPLVPCQMIDPSYLEFVVAEHLISYPLGAAFFKDASGFLGELLSKIDTTDAQWTRFRLSDTNYRYHVYAEFLVMPKVAGQMYEGDIEAAGSDFRFAVDTDETNYSSFDGGASGGKFMYTFNRYDFESTLQAISPGSISFDVRVKTWNVSGTVKAYISARSEGIFRELGTITGGDQIFHVNCAAWGWGFDFGNMFQNMEVGIGCAAGASVDLYGIWFDFLASPPSAGRKPAAVSMQTRTFGHTRTNAYPWGAASAFKTEGSAQRAQASDTNIFVGCKGALFTSSMTRSNGHSTSDVIETPPYMIEWILRYKLGLSTGDINTASFDAIGNTSTGSRKNWKLALVLAAEEDAMEVIREICFESGLQLFVNAAGQYSLAAMDNRGADYTLAESDIAFDESKGPLFEISSTPNSAIVNDFPLNFAIDQQTQEPTAEIYLSDIDADGTVETNLQADSGAPDGGSYSDWVAASRSRYGTVKKLSVTLAYIRDAATAEAALKKLADWLCFERVVVRASLVRTASTIAIEQGDVILLDFDGVPASIRNSTPFLVTRIHEGAIDTKGGTTYIDLEAEEVPNSGTGVPLLNARFISSSDLSTV